MGKFLSVDTYLLHGKEKDYKVVDISNIPNHIVTLSVAETLETGNFTNKTYSICCDEPIWVLEAQAIDQTSETGLAPVLISCGKDNVIYRHRLGTNKVHKVTYSEATGHFSAGKILRIKQKTITQGDSIMNTTLEQMKQKANEMKGFEGAGRTKAVANTTGVTIATDSTQRAAARKTFGKLARVVCFVTSTDKKVSISASSITPKEIADLQISSSATPDQIAQIKAAGKPSELSAELKAICKPLYKLGAKEAKPSKAVGVILEVPAYMEYFASYTQLDDLEEHAEKGGTDYNETKMILVPIDEFQHLLPLIGPSIREHDAVATAGVGPRTIEAVIVPKKSKDATGATVVENITKIGVVVNNAVKSPISDTNFYALNTYKTVDIAKTGLTAEQVVDMNIGYFGNFGKPVSRTVTKGDKANNVPANKIELNETKFDCISDEYKDLVSIAVDGNITSQYFGTAPVSTSVAAFQVSAFYDTNVLRSSFDIPVKVRTETKEGKERYTFVKFSALKPENSAEYMTHGPNAKFAHIVKVVGQEFMTPEKLSDKFGRKGNGGGKSLIRGMEASSLIRDNIAKAEFAATIAM